MWIQEFFKRNFTIAAI